jgi:uncharacterized protein with HEPN domain
MLPDIKNDLMYLLNMIESIEKIAIYVQDCDNAEFFYGFNEQLNYNASLNLFTNIGENCGKISIELKQHYSDIEWQKIKGFRNRVVHDYINIDAFRVFDIIKSELPLLKVRLMDILRIEFSKGSFDKEELSKAQQSYYYRHISFDTFI